MGHTTSDGIINEKDLIKQVKNGVAEAWDVLLRQYRGYLFRYLLTMYTDPNLVEDMIQETYLRVIGHIQQFQGTGSFRSWLRSIARNTAINYFRDQGLHRLDVRWNVYEQEPIEACIESRMIEWEQKQRLNDCIQKLPNRQRKTVCLRVYDDLAFADIARRMQCSESTAKANHYQAVKAILRQSA